MYYGAINVPRCTITILQSSATHSGTIKIGVDVMQSPTAQEVSATEEDAHIMSSSRRLVVYTKILARKCRTLWERA